jgi:large conductance mechanosensitive channel
MWKDFRQFVMRGNIIDLAIGISVGTAFGAIAKSLVNDVLMPPIGLVLGGVNFANFYILLKAGTPPPPYPSLTEAQAAGAVTVNYGVFVNSVISFLIIAVVMFLLIRALNKLKRQKPEPQAQPTTKECPYCLSKIQIKATRCAYCTSQLT